MRVTRLLGWPGAAILGVGAEWSAYDWADARRWFPDLVVGLTLIACGLIGSRRRPESGSGVLMLAAGVAWFLPDFATTGISAVDWVLSHLLYAHRGPLMALALTYPLGRPRGALETTTVTVGCLAALATPVWQNESASIAIGFLLLAVASRRYVAAVGRERRLRHAAWWATAALAAILVGVGVAHIVAAPTANKSILLAYQLCLVVFAAALLAALINAPWEPRRIRDLVVELGETRSEKLREALARALGDPTLQVGYWSPPVGCYLDADGRPLDLPTPASQRVTTPIERDGEPIAVLIHDPAVLHDRGLLDAIGTASALAAKNVRLQAEVDEQVVELEASRRRLLEAADHERRRLEQRLHSGAERRLSALRPTVEQAASTMAAGSEGAARFERVGEQLERSLDELRQLAQGLHPRTLVEQGLAEALRELVAESAVPVDLSLPGRALPQIVESALYFVCAEALANAAKYAVASHVALRVSIIDGAVVAEVADNGVGGADQARGTGLAGLADRIDALGGRLSVASDSGAGTRITAEIPLTGS